MGDETIKVGTIRRLAGGAFEGKLSRVYEGHTRAEVWKFLTVPASMAQWLAAGTIELRVGGAVNIDFHDSGVVIASHVTELDPERVLTYSWSNGKDPERPLRWQLDDDPAGVKLTLTVHTPANEDPGKACAGFEGHLEMLGAALEGVPIKFPFDVFLAARTAYRGQLE